MADIKIANAEYYDVPAIEVETPDGETVIFTEGSGIPGNLGVRKTTFYREGFDEFDLQIPYGYICFDIVPSEVTSVPDGCIYSLNVRNGIGTLWFVEEGSIHSYSVDESDFITAGYGCIRIDPLDIGIPFYGGYDVTAYYGVDLSSDTVTADKMLTGTTAHDANGQPITGSIAERNQSDLVSSATGVTIPSGYYPNQLIGTPNPVNISLNNNYFTEVSCDFESMQNSVIVTPTMTVAKGYVLAGTKDGDGAIISASDLVSGTKTLTATESAQNDIDVTNYEKVSLTAIPSNYVGSSILDYKTSNVSVGGVLSADSTSLKINLSSREESDYVCSDDTTFQVTYPLSNFGDATAADVVSGKYFTSFAGLKMVGTKQDSGSGGLAYATELYSSDSTSITYTSTTAGTALTVSGLSGVYNYPFILVVIENTNTASTGTAKFVRSCVAIGNTKFGQGSASVARYGTMHYYTTGNVLTNYSGSSYGLFGYTLGSSSVTIRGRCNSTYCSTLTGTYKIRILGIKF